MEVGMRRGAVQITLVTCHLSPSARLFDGRMRTFGPVFNFPLLLPGPPPPPRAPAGLRRPKRLCPLALFGAPARRRVRTREELQPSSRAPQPALLAASCCWYRSRTFLRHAARVQPRDPPTQPGPVAPFDWWGGPLALAPPLSSRLRGRSGQARRCTSKRAVRVMRRLCAAAPRPGPPRPSSCATLVSPD
jgi:hypothetical protein